MASRLVEMLRRELDDWRCGWSVGSFGALAEFHREEGEPLERGPGFACVTGRGALRLFPGEDVRAVAYETPSPRPHRWSQGIALCLPAARARRACRSVLTEIGPDGEAMRDEDRDAILFDMGLAQPHIDFCVRTKDPELVAALRAACGTSVLQSAVMGVVLKKHPHRVALSNLGRAEVYQKIGGAETGGVSPLGPHTHVLPKLLASGLTHARTMPIPDGLLPCAYAYPGNPVIGPAGEDRDFDAELFDRFQGYLRAWGSEAYGVKAAVWDAMAAGVSPRDFAAPRSRHGRTAVRLAVRQRARIAETQGGAAEGGPIAAWRAAFDRAEPEAGETDETGEPHAAGA